MVLGSRDRICNTFDRIANMFKATHIDYSNRFCIIWIFQIFFIFSGDSAKSWMNHTKFQYISCETSALYFESIDTNRTVTISTVSGSLRTQYKAPRRRFNASMWPHFSSVAIPHGLSDRKILIPTLTYIHEIFVLPSGACIISLPGQDFKAHGPYSAPV